MELVNCYKVRLRVTYEGFLLEREGGGGPGMRIYIGSGQVMLG